MPLLNPGLLESVKPSHKIASALLLATFLIFPAPTAQAMDLTLCERALGRIMDRLPKLFPKRAAARRIILGLGQDISEVSALRDAGKRLHPANLGDQFVAEMENQDPPAFLEAIGGLEMGNPGIREHVEARFFPRVEAELNTLSQQDRVAVLGWLSQSPLAWSNTGIKLPIAKFERGDPVYDFLGASNEMRNFGGSVAKYALKKLAVENTLAAWDHIVAEAGNSDAQFGATQIVKSASANPVMLSALTRRRSELQKSLQQFDKDSQKALANDRRFQINPSDWGSHSDSVRRKRLGVQWQLEKIEALIEHVNPK